MDEERKTPYAFDPAVEIKLLVPPIIKFEVILPVARLPEKKAANSPVAAVASEAPGAFRLREIDVLGAATASAVYPPMTADPVPADDTELFEDAFTWVATLLPPASTAASPCPVLLPWPLAVRGPELSLAADPLPLPEALEVGNPPPVSDLIDAAAPCPNPWPKPIATPSGPTAAPETAPLNDVAAAAPARPARGVDVFTLPEAPATVDMLPIDVCAEPFSPLDDPVVI